MFFWTYLFIKESWKRCITVFKNIKHHNCFWRFILIVNVSWASNQHIRMISERSCDTEGCNYGCWKFSFAINGINYILKCIQIENYRDPKGTFAKIKKYTDFRVRTRNYCVLTRNFRVRMRNFLRAHKKLFASLRITVSGCVNSSILQQRKQEHGCTWINLIEINSFLGARESFSSV